MLSRKIQGGEAVKILGQVMKKSNEEKKYLISGIRAANKQPVKKLIWADFLVYGKQSADALKASQLKKAGQGAGGQPKNDEIPKVEPPKNDEIPKVEPPKNDEIPKVEPPKNDEIPKVEPPENDEIPKVEPPKNDEIPKVEPPKNDEIPKVEPPKNDEIPKVEPPKNDEIPKVEPPKNEDEQPEGEGDHDEDDELLKELNDDEQPILDDDEAEKGIHDLERELEEGKYDDVRSGDDRACGRHRGLRLLCAEIL